MGGNIVIVGGGLAGLTTATRATELGLKPTVLEQGADTDYLCNSRVTAGVVHIASESPVEEPKFLTDKIARITENFVDSAVISPIIGDAHRAIKWLQGHAVKFGRISPKPRHHWVLAPLRMARPGLDPTGWRGRAGDALLRLLTDKIRKGGGEIVLGTKAKDLLFDGAKCVGVRAVRDGKPAEYRGDAVVLADGGFQADEELVRRFITKSPERVQRRNAGTGTGDAVRMLEAAGAKLVGMKYFYGHLMSRDAMKREDLWPYPGLDSLAVAGIVVDSKGERRFDEGLGGVYLSNAMAWSEDPLGFWAIFDDAIWNGPGKEELFSIGANPGLQRLGAPMFQAPDIATLESQAGFAPGSIAKTVKAHNEALAGNALSSLTPKRSTGLPAAMQINTPPFYAVPLCTGLTFTMGGAAVDSDLKVRRQDNSIIERLYVAGKSAGGLEGGETVGYVGGLSLSVITGIRAAESIAREISGG